MSAGYVIYSLDWDKFRQVVERPTNAQLMRMGKLLRERLKENDGEFDDGDPVADWPTDAKALAEIAAKRLPLPDWYGDLSDSGKSVWENMIFDACMKGKDIDVGFRVDSDGVYWDVIELAWKKLGVVPKVISNVAMSTFGARPYRYHPPAGPTMTREDYDRENLDENASRKELTQFLEMVSKGIGRGEMDANRLLEELANQQGISQQHKQAIKDLLSDVDDDSSDEEIDWGPWTPMHSMHPPEEVRQMFAELESVRPAIKAAMKMRTGLWKEYNEELMPALERIVADGRMLFVQVDT